MREESLLCATVRAEVGQVSLEAHLEIYDLHSGLPGSVNHCTRGRDRLLDAADRNAHSVEHSSGRAECVLHVDDEHCGSGGIEVDGFGSGLESHGVSFLIRY
jgi:hypothetical protein